ncbi:hypothetical protein BHE74_00010148 [Ensete ventricosum]|uniref:BRCT domain-containing protein n=1 Tax=Ensete ventricosum TaxID=4639 RepID=A0A426XH77_ENSVE|nr:hypothetical protein B296_00046772 [Ensete ventricosum]RWW81484.1 hypothetical protein BHE74_00010148 [Ensete ventricosum]
MTGGSVEVVSSKGCSRLFVGSSTFLPSANSLRFMSMMSPASSSLSEPTVPLVNGPFAGLVICVTGLSKATIEGATFLNDWFIGCRASHIVCEGPSIRRYMGHANNLVTPLWVLKTAKEKCMQRLVHLSSDLAKQVSVMLENAQTAGEVVLVGYGASVHPVSKNSRHSLAEGRVNESLEERQKEVELAKLGVRSRRCRRIQVIVLPFIHTMFW